MSDKEPAAWCIRNIAPVSRKSAVEAAQREAVDIGPWVTDAIDRKLASDRGGLVGQVVPRPQSDGESDRPDPVATVLGLASALAQIGTIKGCGGTAGRLRAVLDQHLAMLATGPLPRRRAAPRSVAAIASQASPSPAVALSTEPAA